MPRRGRGWAMRAGSRGEEIHSPLVVSLLEPTLLVLLKEQPGHGYSLLSELNALDITTMYQKLVKKGRK